MTEHRSDPLLHPEQVYTLVGLRKSAINERIKKGKFPEPIRLSENCRRWRESEILRWQAEQPRGLTG